MTPRPAPASPAPETRHLPLDAIAQDVKLALRVLLTDRGYAATVLGTLAVALGVTVAAAAVYQSVVMRPLPFPEPDRLVTLYNLYPGAGVTENGQNSVPHYFERREQIAAFEEVGVYRGSDRTLDVDGKPERIPGALASPSLFRVLEVEPEAGRLFGEADGEVGNEKKVVLTEGLWRRLYGGSSDALGRTLRLDGESYDVIGVLPKRFHLPGVEAQLWLPAAFSPEDRAFDRRHSNNWNMLARLEPGASVDQARAQVDALNARERERFPEMAALLDAAGFTTRVRGFHEDLVADVRPALTLLLVGALFVLLIAGANLVNLTLARSGARRRTLATRCALGAGLRRVTAQLATEGWVLSLAGAGLGLLLGSMSLRLLAAFGSDRIPRGDEIALHLPVVLLAVAVAAAIGALLAAIPVAQLSKSDLQTCFREDSRTGSASRSAVAGRDLLVAVQVAVAAILLVGSGLLLASFLRLLSVDPGFRPEGVATTTVALPGARYPDGPSRVAFADRLAELVRTMPGVSAAALASSVPFGGNFSANAIAVEGYERRPDESVLAPFATAVTPGFFETLGVPLLEGRDFGAGDRADSMPVVIVDRWLAERFWPGESPLGKRIAQGAAEVGDDLEWRTIVGVVGEVRMSELGDGGQSGAYYLPQAQAARMSRTLVVAARTATDAAALAEPLRRTVAEVDPALPTFDAATMEQRLSRSLSERRAAMVLSLAFGAVALFLAAIGLFGVLSYAVARRTRELGIRMVLGSTPGGILALVLGRSARVTGIGLAVGLGGAALLTRWMAGLLYGVGATDPAVFGAAAAVLIAVALAASLAPARRAVGVDPGVVLNTE